jgi:hypothetical protein
VYPGEDFFDLGNEVDVICRECSKCVSNVVDRWGGVARYTIKVRGGVLGREKTFMDRGEALQDNAEPGVAVDCAVRGVEGGGQNLAEAVEGGDTGPGQLRVRDGVVGKWVGDMEGFDVDIIDEAEKKFVGGRRLLRDAGVREFEERLAQRVGLDRRRGKRWGRVEVRQFECWNKLGNMEDDVQGGSARKTRRSP